MTTKRSASPVESEAKRVQVTATAPAPEHPWIAALAGPTLDEWQASVLALPPAQLAEFWMCAKLSVVPLKRRDVPADPFLRMQPVWAKIGAKHGWGFVPREEETAEAWSARLARHPHGQRALFSGLKRVLETGRAMSLVHAPFEV